jgi:hypothetical protein
MAEVLSVAEGRIKDTDEAGKPVQITGIFLQESSGNVSGVDRQKGRMARPRGEVAGQADCTSSATRAPHGHSSI